MPRWDYDTVFYRVFCITLLGITFTFTVILTNVFIDIDGILFKKNKEHVTVNSEQGELHTQLNFITPNIDGTAYDYKDYGNDNEPFDAERTKRSVEIQDTFKTIKDMTIKKVISRRLAALLEDLEKEEPDKNKSQENEKKNNDDEKEKTEKSKEVANDTEKPESLIEKEEEKLIDLKSRDDFENEIVDYLRRVKAQEKEQRRIIATEDEMKHLAMHNIILQGVIGHMDLNEVYHKMNMLMKTLERTENKDIKKDMVDALNPTEEKGLFDELINCKQLKQEIDDEMKLQTEKENLTGTKKAKKVMIKTIIDISSLNDKTNQRDASSKESVNGIIKLIYNGNELKFKRFDGITTTEKPKSKQRIDKLSSNIGEKLLTTTKTPKTETYVPKMYTNKIINDYLKKMSESGKLFNETSFGKRLKRHINIQYDNEDIPPKKHGHPKNKDDELFLEIETHFNSNGLKGAEKKKMIRDLISKIQKAIRAEKESLPEKPKRHKHLHVKKRTQNPLDKEGHKPLAHEKPIYFLVRRDSDPISKSFGIHDKPPGITNHRGDNWHQKNNQPRFLGEQKGINSIEMGELNAEYSQGIQNTISERVQKPLTIQTLYNPLDPRSAKFIMKDIAGSGFSIGFNQYVDDPPDAASMNLFSGIENIIKTYHQKYDEATDTANGKDNHPIPEDIPSVHQEYTPSQYHDNPDYPPNQEYPENRDNTNRGSQEYLPYESNQHTIVRRSIEKTKTDFHSDEYDILYKNILDNNHNKKKDHSFTKNYALKFIDDNIFAKELKPSEILSLANLLGRKKRSINVKKIKNLRNHRSLNRYLNTKSMASKMIFQHNKRSKRQIDKIRIVAKDRSTARKQDLNSAEEIFVLSSNENMFSNRAIIKQIDNPFGQQEEHKNNYDNEHYDILSSSPSKQQSEEHYDIITGQKEPVPEYIEHQVPQEPYYVAPQPQQAPPQDMDENDGVVYEAPDHSSEQNYDADLLSRRFRHNPLMSKYPHIFMDEITRSKEQYRPETFPYERVNDNIPDPSQIVNTDKQMLENEFTHNVMPKTSDMDGIVGLYAPHDNNYKLTVKILPKNGTGLNSGFKETHTSINKSYNKNGLIYTSLVNVSEISKVENINNVTNVEVVTPHPFVKTLNEEQTKMRYIIQEHKNRIDEQLAHLMAEKEKLLHIEVNTGDFLKEPSTDYLQVAPWSALGQTLTNDNYNKQTTMQNAATTTESLTTITDEPTTTDKPTTTHKPTTESTTTETLPPTTTTEPQKPVTEDHFKSNLINKISKNEVLTDEILKKIDKNTEILEKFVEKMIYKIESGYEAVTTTQKLTTTQNPDKVKKPEPFYNTYDFNSNLNSPIPRPDDFLHKIPEIFFKQVPYAKLNSTVPFVYAFQHPYMSQNSRDKNIANVVYQGHIHTQTSPDIPEIALQNNLRDHAFPQTNEHERTYQARPQSIQSLEKIRNEKKLESSYPNIRNLKSDRGYQNIDTLKKDQSYPNMPPIKTDQGYQNMQTIKTDQSYTNMQTMKSDKSYPSAKIEKMDYPNMGAITTGQNYNNVQTTKTEENYENARPIKPDQSFPVNIKSNQNFDNVQARKAKQNYNNISIKIDENYKTMPRKQWNDKNTDNNTKWKKNIRTEDIPTPVVVPNTPQNNSTKFFIDELESEFKVVIPIDGKKKF